MPTIVVRGGLLPQQIDDFPEGCKRSCKGAVHIKPGTLIVTDGELKHIQKSRPELSGYLQVVDRTRPAKAVAVPDEVKDDPPATETVTEIPGPTKAEETGAKKRKKRGFPDAH